MNDRARTVPVLPVALLAILLGGAGRAFADLTVFVGGAPTTSRTSVGAALGLSLRPVSVEFEFAAAPGRSAAGKPALQTGLFNLLVGTPFPNGGRLRVYGSVGGGMYRERSAERVRTDLALSAGGGVHLHLAGPFRLRVDYRLFALRGDAFRRFPRRAYAGLDLAF